MGAIQLGVKRFGLSLGKKIEEKKPTIWFTETSCEMLDLLGYSEEIRRDHTPKN
jgi:hypothetical protein